MTIKEKQLQLEEWYSQYEMFPSIPIKKARELLQESYDMPLEEKAKLKNELILGTLEVIYKEIKGSGLLVINSASYGIDDIISAFSELWIERLDENILDKKRCYSICFNYDFYLKLAQKLGINATSPYQFCKLNGVVASDLLVWYINNRNNGKTPSKTEVNDYLQMHSDKNSAFHKEPENLEKTMELLNIIYDRSFREEESKEYVNKSKLLFLMPMLLDSVVTELIGTESNINSLENDVLNEILYEELRTEIFEGELLNEYQKEVIMLRYGFTSDKKTFHEISKEQGLTGRSGTQSRESRAIKLLRNSSAFRKKFSNYNE